MLNDRLLDAIYASVFDDQALHDALGGLARTCRSRSAGMFCLTERGIDWDAGHNVPSQFMQSFAQHVPNDPRVAYALDRPPLTLLDDNVPAMRKAMLASGTDALTRYWDMPYTLACICVRETNATWALYISRNIREGPIGGDAADGFLCYAAHFSRAMMLRIQAQRRMHALHASASGEHATIARLRVDQHARVRHPDPAATAMLRAAEGVAVRRNTLTLATLTATAQLHHLIEYIAHAPYLPMMSSKFNLPQSHPPGMLALQVDGGTRQRARGKILLDVWLERRHWPLPQRNGHDKQPTPRQQEILQLLDQGHTTAEIAATAHVREATVRSHIKHLLALTDTHNRRACLAAAREHKWL